MKTNIFLSLFSILIIASATFAQRCPIGCSCANNTVSVTCYGATPNDERGDSAAIQAGINSLPSFWTLFFPAGVYLVDLPLYINRSNINLMGEGVQSELKTPRGLHTELSLLNLPEVNYQVGCPGGTYHHTPTNIAIEKLSFNGDFNLGRPGCNPSGDCGDLNGILIRQGENIMIRDVLIKNFSREGISIALGSVIPKNISMIRLRTQKIRRTAVHFGYGENIRLEDSSLEDEGSDEWVELGFPVGNPAIDIEVEGSDIECPAGFPQVNHDGYLLGSTIKNTLIMNPTETTSKGGVSASPAYGPIRNVVFTDNVVVNTTGVAFRGSPILFDPPNWYGVRNALVGNSGLVRQINVSRNWISNLHYPDFVDREGTLSVAFVWSGDLADAYGSNDVQFNDNVMTFFARSNTNRNITFSGIKEMYGANNKIFRPYHEISNPYFGSMAFLWDKTNFSPKGPNNMQITNTLDNGWPGSRLVCDDVSQNPAWSFCSLLGINSFLTWVDNPIATPSESPVVRFADVWGARLVVNVEEPNRQQVRLMVYKNGIPQGLKTIESSTNAYISLSSKPIRGDFFELKTFNENGWFGEYSFVY